MPRPRTLFPTSLPLPGYGIFDSITNLLPGLLNAAVRPNTIASVASVKDKQRQ